jgi:hypothetical protein
MANILNPVFGECVHADLIGLSLPAEDKDILNGFPQKVFLFKTDNNSSKH